MRLGKVTKDQNAKLQESAINGPPASKEQETLKSFQFARTNLLRTTTDHFFAEFVEHLKFQIKCRPLHSTFPITDTRQFAILNTSLDLSSISYICSILFAFFFYKFYIFSLVWTHHIYFVRQFGTLYSHSTRDLRITILSELFFRDIVVAGLREKSKPFLPLVKTRYIVFIEINLYAREQ